MICGIVLSPEYFVMIVGNDEPCYQNCMPLVGNGMVVTLNILPMAETISGNAY